MRQNHPAPHHTPYMLPVAHNPYFNPNDLPLPKLSWPKYLLEHFKSNQPNEVMHATSRFIKEYPLKFFGHAAAAQYFYTRMCQSASGWWNNGMITDERNVKRQNFNDKYQAFRDIGSTAASGFACLLALNWSIMPVMPVSQAFNFTFYSVAEMVFYFSSHQYNTRQACKIVGGDSLPVKCAKWLNCSPFVDSTFKVLGEIRERCFG